MKLLTHATLTAIYLWLVVAVAAPLVLAGPEAPRPAQVDIPAVVSPLSRLESKGMAVSRTDPEQTPAPDEVPSRLTGTASWYAAGGPAAAAGPRLRAALGPDWRGKVVTVCASRCIPVALVDFCQCYKGQKRERLIDLGLEAFAQLERPSAGLLRVTIILGPPSTDR